MEGRAAEIRSERDKEDDLLKVEPAAGTRRQRTGTLSFPQPPERSAGGKNCTEMVEEACRGLRCSLSFTKLPLREEGNKSHEMNYKKKAAERTDFL